MIELDNIREFALDKPSGWNSFGSPEDYLKMPDEHRDQILFLDRKANKYLYEYLDSIKLITGPIWNPFEKGNFRTIEEFTNLDNESELKKWLYNRGIPFKNWVLMLPNYHEDPVLLTWKMVVKYSPKIFFQLDDIVIFDKSSNWCLFYFHEEHLYFGKDNIYDPEIGYQEVAELYELRNKFPKFKHPLIPSKGHE